MATFVLIHGSWHGAWCWRTVASGLAEGGHGVFAPTLSGCAERFHHAAEAVTLQTHIDDIARLLFYEDLNAVTLVAHSYAGMVAQGVCNALPERISSVVYLDAYVVPSGSRGFDLWTKERLDEARLSMANGDPFRPPLAPALLGIDDPDAAEWVEQRLTPHPLATYDCVMEPESPTAKCIPRVYVQCTDGPLASTFAPIVRAVSERGWPVLRLAAPHDAMLTHPDLLLALLRRHCEGLERV